MCDLLAANQPVKNATVEVIATQSVDELASENTTVVQDWVDLLSILKVYWAKFEFIAYALAHRVPEVFEYLVLITYWNFNGRRSRCILCDSQSIRHKKYDKTRQDKVSESLL